MSGMVTGGFSGIAILVKEWTEGVVPGGIPLWITNLSLNIPLFLIGMKLSGFQFVKRALVGEIALLISVPLCEKYVCRHSQRNGRRIYF